LIPLNGNSTSTALSSGAAYTGNWFDANFYQSHETIIVTAKTDQDGVLYIDFSPDGTNVDRSLTFSVSASISELHRLTIVNQFFRTRFVNSSGSAQSYLRIQTLLSNNTLMGTPLNVSMQSDTDSIPVKAVLHGETDGGEFLKTPVDTNGHLEVAIHSPRNPFGSIHTESLTPVLSHDATHGIDAVHQLTTINASGSVTESGSMFVCQTGTTIYGAGSLTSRRRVKYRPGQGIVGRFTAMFTTPVASSYQIGGFGTPENGLYFGYVGTQFGILHGKNGVSEVRTLTITTKSSHAENAVVTLNGTAFNVAVTNGASTVTTAYEISQGAYTGWRAEAIGSTVLFINNSVGAKSGSFSISGTSVVGTFAQTKAGVALTETFIPQSSWNGDKLDGTGNSGITIDPTKINVFQIGIQYLGAGAVVFQVEAAYAGNNPDWVTVHTMLNPNTLTAPFVSNPTFQFQLSAYSAGSTTNLTVKSASYAAFVEGEKLLIGNRYSFYAQNTSVGATNYQCLFSVRNSRYFNGRTNQVVAYIQSVLAALKHTSPCTVYVFRDAALAGSPNFSQYDANSGLYLDTAATTCTIASNRQIVWSGPMGDTGQIDYVFPDEVTIQPGETITVAARAATGSPSWVTASLNTREDQ
jgi:hypothetical protein